MGWRGGMVSPSKNVHTKTGDPTSRPTKLMCYTRGFTHPPSKNHDTSQLGWRSREGHTTITLNAAHDLGARDAALHEGDWNACHDVSPYQEGVEALPTLLLHHPQLLKSALQVLRTPDPEWGGFEHLPLDSCLALPRCACEVQFPGEGHYEVASYCCCWPGCSLLLL